MAKKTDQGIASYNDLSMKLDDVVAKLQDPAVSIDDAVTFYGDAMKLIKQLQLLLDQAENNIEKIRAQNQEAE